MTKNKNDETFVRITNRDIFDEIKDTSDKIEIMKNTNTKEHADIVKHQLHTNGDVKGNKIWNKVNFTLIIIAIGYIIKTRITG